MRGKRTPEHNDIVRLVHFNCAFLIIFPHSGGDESTYVKIFYGYPWFSKKFNRERARDISGKRHHKNN
jgi:hypothetical protein